MYFIVCLIHASHSLSPSESFFAAYGRIFFLPTTTTKKSLFPFSILWTRTTTNNMFEWAEKCLHFSIYRVLVSHCLQEKWTKYQASFLIWQQTEENHVLHYCIVCWKYSGSGMRENSCNYLVISINSAWIVRICLCVYIVWHRVNVFCNKTCSFFFLSFGVVFFFYLQK